MNAVENAAFVSIGRASGFAGLAIFCVMFGLSFDPANAAKVGGELCLAVSAILAFRGWTARRRSYKKTELWIIIDKAERPPAGVAQQVVGAALREAYFWFAQSAAIIALVLLLSSLALSFAYPGDAQAADAPPAAATVAAPSSGSSTLTPVLMAPMGPGFDFLQNP
ncbi:MAG: hypothetical protein VW405_13740 [Rhodospirillaceae bacterium]